jgi:hypothetical protein
MGGEMANDQTEAPGDTAILEKLAALGARKEEHEDTPGVFLATLSETLMKLPGVDVELAGILSDHLLKVTPHANAVANSKAAIVALAAKRAAQVEEQADG